MCQIVLHPELSPAYRWLPFSVELVKPAMSKRERAGTQPASHLYLFLLPERSHGATGAGAKTMLLTIEIRTQLRRNFDLSKSATYDHKPVVKLFTPDANATWLFSELESDDDTLFGLCDLGHGTPELGYASLTEISCLRGRFGLLVERDRHFRASKTLSEYADDSDRHGAIRA
jgi:hypothetical protein